MIQVIFRMPQATPGSLPSGTNRLEHAIDLLQNNRPQQASAILQDLLNDDPADANALHLLGLAAFQQTDLARSAELIEQAIQVQPNSAVFHHNLAAAYRGIGRIEDAENQYRIAIRLKPDYYEAYYNWTSVCQFEPGDIGEDTFDNLLKTPNIGARDRSFLHFAAGKFFSDIGQYDRAFEHYAAGNQLMATEPRMDSAIRFVEQIEATFDRALMQTQQTATSSAEPSFVFVVGMPRSGTTLVEQVLATHPQCWGAGEQRLIGNLVQFLAKHVPSQPYPQCIHALSAAELQGMRAAYLKSIATDIKPGQVLVDKMPANFLHVGLIALLLPQARIIHCMRDPMATCLSCFLTRFSEGNEFSYSLTNLGIYYRLFRRLTTHWQAECPLPQIELHYEDLVLNQEAATRRLLEFCRLDWQPQCLQFHRCQRTVTTASSWQVRKPLHRNSLQKWRHFEAHLGPLAFSLGGTEQRPTASMSPVLGNSPENAS